MGISHVRASDQPPSAPPPSSPRDPLAIPAEVKASIKILLVDDDRSLRESCASVLQMDGYSVTLAGRGEEALEMVKRRKFDIILVDLYMSQVSGLELLRAALDTNRDTIVVVMTGNPNGPGLPEWTPYDPVSEPYLDLGNPIRAGSHVFKAELDFLDRYYLSRPPTGGGPDE